MIGKQFVTHDQLNTTLRNLLRQISQAGFSTNIGGGGAGGGGGGGGGVPAAVSGAIIYGTAAPSWTTLAAGAAGTYLAGGAAPSWATLNQAAVAGLTVASSPTFVGATLSGLTAGRVPYVGAGGLLSDTTVYWDSVNSRMGVNTAVPAHPFDLTGTARIQAGSLILPNAQVENQAYGIFEGATPLIRTFRPTGADGFNLFIGNSGNTTLSPGGGAVMLASRNWAAGEGAQVSLTTGYGNFAAGVNAQGKLTSGYLNWGAGYNVHFNLTTGYNNFGAGYGVQTQLVSAVNCTAAGAFSQYLTTGTINSAFGAYSQYNLTTGIYNNAFGFESQYNRGAASRGCAFGHQSAKAGGGTDAFGYQCLFNATSTNNSVFGYAGYYTLSSGNFHTGCGFAVGYYYTTGTGSISIGYYAGVGATVAHAPATDDYGILMGYEANRSVVSATKLTNYIGIGYRTLIGKSNQVIIGNTSILETRLYGNLALGSAGNPHDAIFGTNAVRVWGQWNGTAPTTSPADCYQMWSANRGGVDGKAGMHMRAEDGTLFCFSDLSGIGTQTPTFTKAGGAWTSRLMIEGISDAAHEDLTFLRQHDTLFPRASFLRSRALATTVADDDYLGMYLFRAHDGTDYNDGAGFAARIDGAVAANQVPTELIFWTTETNALVERMILSPAGHLWLTLDDKYFYCGAAKDMGFYYDGTSGHIKTDLVAASDLHVDCGAAKTVVLDVPVYDDINFSVGRGKAPGVGNPNWQPFCGDSNNNGYQFGIGEYIDLGTEELYHDWKEGTVITPHVHIVLSDTLAAEEKVQFRLYYSIGDVNGAMSAEGSVDGEATIADTTAVRTHVLINFTAIDLAAYHIGSMIVCQLHRIAKSAGGTELSDEPFVMNVGLHIQKDTMGSRQISAK